MICLTSNLSFLFDNMELFHENITKHKQQNQA